MGQPSSNGTILLIEDYEPVRNFMRTLLESHGYKVLEARTSAEAHQAIQGKEPIDLLICDEVLPSVRGSLLAKELAAVQPGLKVLVISGSSKEALAITNADFLQKPFDHSTILEKVRELLLR